MSSLSTASCRPRIAAARRHFQKHRGPGFGPTLLSRLASPQPAEPTAPREHEVPGQMLQIDTKKRGRIERPSHRVTGNRKD